MADSEHPTDCVYWFTRAALAAAFAKHLEQQGQKSTSLLFARDAVYFTAQGMAAIAIASAAVSRPEPSSN